MSTQYDKTRWPNPEDPFEVRYAWSQAVSPGERWAWASHHALPRTDDDLSVLAGGDGRPATREEMLAFVAGEQDRIARRS